MDSGRILARGTPAEVRALAPSGGGAPASLEDAFVAIIAAGREEAEGGHTKEARRP